MSLSDAYACGGWIGCVIAAWRGVVPWLMRRCKVRWKVRARIRNSSQRELGRGNCRIAFCELCEHFALLPCARRAHVSYRILVRIMAARWRFAPSMLLHSRLPGPVRQRSPLLTTRSHQTISSHLRLSHHDFATKPLKLKSYTTSSTSLTRYLIPSLRLRRTSFLRLRIWKPACTCLMKVLICGARA